jgi:hypothetical protein
MRDRSSAFPSHNYVCEREAFFATRSTHNVRTASVSDEAETLDDFRYHRRTLLFIEQATKESYVKMHHSGSTFTGCRVFRIPAGTPHALQVVTVTLLSRKQSLAVTVVVLLAGRTKVGSTVSLRRYCSQRTGSTRASVAVPERWCHGSECE